MAIKNKDGSVFKLRGPNPLMRDQKFWEGNEDVVVHNFDKIKSVDGEESTATTQKFNSNFGKVYETTYTEDEMPKESRVVVLPKEKQEEPKQTSFTYKAKPKPETETPKIEKDELKEEPIASNEKNKSHFRNLERVYLHCLPANIKSVKDRLYGETKTEISYDKPFRFQAAVVTNQDMIFEFWTTIEKVKKGSIVYHSEYRNWWKVNKVMPTVENDGFIAQCIQSDTHPDFSSLE